MNGKIDIVVPKENVAVDKYWSTSEVPEMLVTPLRRSTGGLMCCQPSVHGRTDSLPPPSLPPSLPIGPPSLLPSTSPPARLPQLTPWLTFLDTLPRPQVPSWYYQHSQNPPANTSVDGPSTDILSTTWLSLFETPPSTRNSKHQKAILPSQASFLGQ